MQKPKPPKVRLAASGTPCREVFNFYQIISLLSGLYIKAAELEGVTDYRLAWDFASESLLTQVGDSYDLWQIAQKGSSDGIPIPDDEALIKRTERLALRIVAFEENLSMWSPVSRWGRVMGLIERKLLILAEQIAAHNPYVTEKVREMAVIINKRQESMAIIEASALREDSSLRQNFAVPVAL